MNKNLICYFSATGTTKDAALKIANALNGDLFEIEPVVKYTAEDLDWTNKNSRSTLEMASPDSRPGVKNKVVNIDEYSNVFIGFPVWWYKEPTIVDTFIEENDLKNKNVYVFITSGGSTVDGSLESLKQKYRTLNFVSGKRISGNTSADEILEWVK